MQIELHVAVKNVIHCESLTLAFRVALVQFLPELELVWRGTRCVTHVTCKRTKHFGRHKPPIDTLQRLESPLPHIVGVLGVRQWNCRGLTRLLMTGGRRRVFFIVVRQACEGLARCFCRVEAIHAERLLESNTSRTRPPVFTPGLRLYAVRACHSGLLTLCFRLVVRYLSIRTTIGETLLDASATWSHHVAPRLCLDTVHARAGHLFRRLFGVAIGGEWLALRLLRCDESEAGRRIGGRHIRRGSSSATTAGSGFVNGERATTALLPSLLFRLRSRHNVASQWALRRSSRRDANRSDRRRRRRRRMLPFGGRPVILPPLSRLRRRRRARRVHGTQ